MDIVYLPQDYQWMAKALMLSEKGFYSARPNPCVGCVIVNDNKVVGEGWHIAPGLPHAEVNAIRDAGDKARGASLYVTLEPCCHFGKTPPCCELLISSGISSVYVAVRDPNPEVSGSGIQRLQEAGIKVFYGLLEAQARELNTGFFNRMETNKPYIRCKLAMSVDGRTALSDGSSKWISSEDSRRDVQKWRAHCGAIVTGVGTVLTDDPSMNIRDSELMNAESGESFTIQQPLRVLLDSDLKVPVDAKLFQSGQVIVITQNDEPGKMTALQRAGAEVVVLPRTHHGINLHYMTKILVQREINDVLVEAGATLSGSLLESGLVDELLIYMAPKLLGDSGKGLFHLTGIREMRHSIGLDVIDVRMIGKDVRYRAKPVLRFE